MQIFARIKFTWCVMSTFKRKFVQNAGSTIIDPLTSRSNDGKISLKKRRNATSEKVSSHVNLKSKLEIPLEISTEALTLQHPELLAKPLKSPEAIYILNEKLSELIVKNIKPISNSDTTPIIEVNPGPGFVTAALLKAGVPNLTVFEKRKEFHPYLQRLQSKFDGRLNICHDDFYSIPRIEWKCIHQETSNPTIKDIKVKAWSEDPPLKIFAVMPPKIEIRYLRSLLQSCVAFDGLFSCGRTQFLVFLSEKEYKCMIAKPTDKFHHYRSASILYQTLFDIEMLHKEARHSFHPPPQKQHLSEDNLIYLVRLTPKRSLLDILSPELLGEFNGFVRQHYTKRRGLICQTLDRWIPETSARLKELNISSDIMFGNLTPMQVLTLFLHFSSWPEYENCLFRTALRKAYADLDKTEDTDEYLETE